MHDPTPIGWFLIGGLLAVVAGLPLVPIAVRANMRRRVQQDEKMIGDMAIDELWQRTGLADDERSRCTLFVFNRLSAGADFHCGVKRDGKAAGRFESRDTTSAVFPVENLNVTFHGKSELNFGTEEAPKSTSSDWHVVSPEHGDFAVMKPEKDWSQPRILSGADEYSIVLGKSNASIQRNGQVVGAYFRMPNYIVGVALETTIPDPIKALLSNLIVRHI